MKKFFHNPPKQEPGVVYDNLGRSGLKVPRIYLGAMSFWKGRLAVMDHFNPLRVTRPFAGHWNWEPISSILPITFRREIWPVANPL